MPFIPKLKFTLFLACISLLLSFQALPHSSPFHRQNFPKDTTLLKDTLPSIIVTQDSLRPQNLPKPVFNYTNVRDYIFEHLYYPAEAIAKEIEGKVYVHFCIEKDGKIDDIKIVTSVHPLLDSAAFHLIRNMPQWQPVTRKGIPERISYTIPVIFELNP